MRTLAEALASIEARSTRSERGCLLTPTKAYASLRYGVGVSLDAHRAAYMIHNGPIPSGYFVRHTCDDRRCIEPAHLLVGTPADNQRDMAERKRGLIGLRHHFATVEPEVIAAAIAEYLRGGVSQRDMAARLGVSKTSFGTWVRGEFRRDVGHEGVSVGVGSRLATGLKGCGTYAGYDYHKSHKTPVCDPCKRAASEYRRARKLRLTAA